MLRKEIINGKREILCNLMNERSYTTEELLTNFKDKDYTFMLSNDDLQLEHIAMLLCDLKNERYVEIGKDGNCLTDAGEELAEHWSNQDRWDLTMKICSELNDFSVRTVSRIYDKILEKEIDSLI